MSVYSQVKNIMNNEGIKISTESSKNIIICKILNKQQFINANLEKQATIFSIVTILTFNSAVDTNHPNIFISQNFLSKGEITNNFVIFP